MIAYIFKMFGIKVLEINGMDGTGHAPPQKTLIVEQAEAVEILSRADLNLANSEKGYSSSFPTEPEQEDETQCPRDEIARAICRIAEGMK